MSRVWVPALLLAWPMVVGFLAEAVATLVAACGRRDGGSA